MPTVDEKVAHLARDSREATHLGRASQLLAISDETVNEQQGAFVDVPSINAP